MLQSKGIVTLGEKMENGTAGAEPDSDSGWQIPTCPSGISPPAVPYLLHSFRKVDILIGVSFLVEEVTGLTNKRWTMADHSNTGLFGEIRRKQGLSAAAKGGVCPFTGAAATRPALG